MDIEGVHCSIPFSVPCSVLAKLFYDLKMFTVKVQTIKKAFPLLIL